MHRINAISVGTPPRFWAIQFLIFANNPANCYPHYIFPLSGIQIALKIISVIVMPIFFWIGLSKGKMDHATHEPSASPVKGNVS